MKYSFSFKYLSVAERFESALRDRNITPEVNKKDDDSVEISYSVSTASCMEDEDKTSESVSKEEVYSMLENMFGYIMSEVQWQMNWIASELAYVEQAFYKHKQGHLPPLHGPAQMEKALQVLGMDGDYEVGKKFVYASEGGLKIKQLG